MATFKEGTYGGSLLKAVLSEAGNGTPQFALRFNVTHIMENGDWQETDGGERTVYLSMSGGAAAYTKKKLQTLGIGEDGPPETVEDPETGDEAVVLPEGIGDDFIELVCREEYYNGAAQLKWDLAKWGGGSMGNKPSDETKAKLKTMW